MNRACISRNIVHREWKVSHCTKEWCYQTYRNITGHTLRNLVPQEQVCVDICFNRYIQLLSSDDTLVFWGSYNTINDFAKLHRCRAVVYAWITKLAVTLETQLSGPEQFWEAGHISPTFLMIIRSPISVVKISWVRTTDLPLPTALKGNSHSRHFRK